jgi:hypothetical protein
MADHNYKADEVAYMLQKPWKYEDEWKAATGWWEGTNE